MKRQELIAVGFMVAGFVGMVAAAPSQAQLTNDVVVSHDAEIVARSSSVVSTIATDWGDAPDPTYPTLSASSGANHFVTPLFLGTLVDDETNGQPNVSATGDDSGANDEDGVAFTSLIDPGFNATVTVTSSGAGLLDAWIDFNTDGDWDEPNEQIFTSEPVSAGANMLMFAVPAGATRNIFTYARFRVSTAGGLSPTGSASDGEVEDYRTTTVPVELMSFSVD